MESVLSPSPDDGIPDLVLLAALVHGYAQGVCDRAYCVRAESLIGRAGEAWLRSQRAQRQNGGGSGGGAAPATGALRGRDGDGARHAGGAILERGNV